MLVAEPNRSVTLTTNPCSRTNAGLAFQLRSGFPHLPVLPLGLAGDETPSWPEQAAHRPYS
ncbi:hypothetical protein BH10ACI4_BH10ACI4_07520 [soil metagenome]